MPRSMGSPLDDPHYKKTVDFLIAGLSLQFRVSQSLFSSHEIDVGTAFLLRTIHREAGEYRKVLDLGCGYGPIGITMKALNPDAVVHMVDRDALAVSYAARNAKLNGLEHATAYPSIGFDDVEDRDFDLIATNVPGKAGSSVIASWLAEAPLHLRPGGQVAIVVVSSLESLVREAIEAIPGAEITLNHRRAGHAIFRYAVAPERLRPVPGDRSLDRGDYDRTDVTFRHGRHEYNLRTVYGLPEFDTLGHRTQLLFSVLETLKRKSSPPRVLVLNPGQGHIPLLLSRLFSPDSISMVDRDLLALRCSARGLTMNGYDSSRVSMQHAESLEGDESRYDLIVAHVSDDEGAQANASLFRQAADRMAPGGQMVVAAGSSTITRLTKTCRAERLGIVGARKRRQGNSVLVVSDNR
ncbi:MAG: methyltransferase [Chloroflexi bacterium]|nr:methyltransferase [Chloroflexota bacterium]